MSRWPTKPLREVADVIRGVSFDKSEVVNTVAPGYLPILRAGNIQESLDLKGDLVWVPAHKVAPEQRMKVGDLAICMSSGSPDVVGKAAQLETDWQGSVGAFCAIVRFRKLHPRFGAFWFRGPGFRAWRDSKAMGASIQNLRKVELEALQIPLPDPPEQERVVRILDEAETLRNLRARADNRTRQLPSALFREMFAEPGSNDTRWPVRSFGELAVSTQLGLVRGADEMGDDKPYAYLRMDAILGDGRLHTELLRRVDASKKEVSAYALQPGDFLFNTRNSRELVGKTAVFSGLNEVVLFNNNIMRVRFSEAIDPYFVLWLFQTPALQNELEQRKSGTTSVVAIYWKALKTVPLPVPPISLQRLFAARVAVMSTLEAAQAASRQRLDSLFRSLLHRAFQGGL